MQFTKRLREGIRRGRIRCSVRIWNRPHVKAGGRYAMEEGQIVVDSIVPIRLKDVTPDLAQESGFSSVKDLLQIAKHGTGRQIYLIRFRYLAPGAWDIRHDVGEVQTVRSAGAGSGRQRPSSATALLQRIRASTPPAARRGETASSRRVRGN
jgi:hypothetical protein